MAGYWKFPIGPDDRDKTTFKTHLGMYQCKSIPFGLRNAPATFQRALYVILSGVRWQKCLYYLADVIVFSHIRELHIEDLYR